MASQFTISRLSLALAFTSGACGLAHQVLWTRRLVDLVGASPQTFSKVVGAFFIGLAAGSALAILKSRPVAHPWRRLAVAEAAVGILSTPAMLAPWLPGLPALPFLLVVPPAAAMGLVLPWLIRALGTSAQNSSLYAANTVGGVAGILLVLLIALPALGLTNAALLICGANAALALCALQMDRITQPVQPLESTQAESSIRPSGLVTAFVSGFLVLGLEAILQHQFAQIAINSFFSSAFVLAWALFALAIAARVRMRDDCALLAAAAACALQPFFVSVIRPGLSILPYELPPFRYFFQLSFVSLLTLFPLFFAAGQIFPAQLRRATDARSAATLLGANGIGGWLGIELTHRWLAPVFGLWQSVVLMGAGYLLLAFRAPRIGLIATAALLAHSFLNSASLPQISIQSPEKLVEVRVGREGVVATVKSGEDDWRMLFNNSYTLGGSRAQFNQERQAILPLLLHGHPKSVAALGVATGSSVAGAAIFPRVANVQAIELSPLVIQQAQKHFGRFNRDIFRSQVVQIIEDDARRAIARAKAEYDVVLGDLFLPWRTGEARLFTRDHFQNVKNSLKPGGLYCQWLPMFQLTRPQFECILRTFRDVFPTNILLRGDFYCELPIIGLLGGRDLSSIDWEGIAQITRLIVADGRIVDPLVRHPEGVAMMLLGPAPDPGPGPVNTLANAWLEWDAARNILGLKSPWFAGIPLAEYVRDIQRASNSRLPVELQSAHESGQFFSTLDVASKVNAASLNNLKSQFIDRIPAPLRDDPGANWKQWPSRVKPQRQ